MERSIIMKNKFPNIIEDKIKNEIEKRNLIYKNIKKEDLSFRDSDEHYYKRMFKLLIKYTSFPKEQYSRELAEALIGVKVRKEFGEKFYNEEYAPSIKKENDEQLNTTVKKQKKTEVNKTKIIENNSQPNKNCIPYNGGLTPEFVKNNWRYARPCDPNEIIETKGKDNNSFFYVKFKGYY